MRLAPLASPVMAEEARAAIRASSPSPWAAYLIGPFIIRGPALGAVAVVVARSEVPQVGHGVVWGPSRAVRVGTVPTSLESWGLSGRRTLADTSGAASEISFRLFQGRRGVLALPCGG